MASILSRPQCVNHIAMVAQLFYGICMTSKSSFKWMPGQRQAIIWTNVGILLIGPIGTNISEIVIEIHTFSLKQMHLKMSPAKWHLLCLDLNELMPVPYTMSSPNILHHYSFISNVTWEGMIWDVIWVPCLTCVSPLSLYYYMQWYAIVSHVTWKVSGRESGRSQAN